MLEKSQIYVPNYLPEDIKEKLEEFVKRLIDKLQVKNILLFGSYAKGDWLKDSDLDLIIISDIFEGMDIGERYKSVKKLAPQGISLEALTYTSKEFEKIKNKSIIIMDALSYAINLFKKSE